MFLYGVKDKKINDSWYCKDGDTYHAFFMQRPNEGGEPDVGHSFSSDLIHWEYAGTAIAPKEGSWDDGWIGTGSIVKFDGKWHMLYAGINHDNFTRGLGVAVSDDLMTWQRVGDNYLIKIWDAMDSYTDRGFPFEWQGKTVYCCPLGDGVIYPEPIDGEYYIFVNSHAVDYPINERGVTTVFKTRDFKEFTPYKIAAFDCCDRMESVCVWEHDGRYYMYVGRIISKTDENCHIIGQDNSNWLFTSDNLLGPYNPVQKLNLQLEQTNPPSFPYIAKVLQDPQGRDVMLINSVPTGVIGPYFVEYLSDGTIDLKSAD